jgi:hypothetical protein
MARTADTSRILRIALGTLVAGLPVAVVLLPSQPSEALAMAVRPAHSQAPATLTWRSPLAAPANPSPKTLLPLSVPVTVPTPLPSTPVPAPSAPAPAVTAPPPAPTTAPVTSPAASPLPASTPTLPTQPTGYGCAAAIAYLTQHAPSFFSIVCPGDAQGHEAMTCVNDPGVCPGQDIIVINDPCPAAYMNEASNAWVLLGLAKAVIDPYGAC